MAGFSPEMRIVAGVDQLRAHPMRIGGSLHTAWSNCSTPELLRNLSRMRSSPLLYAPHDYPSLGDTWRIAIVLQLIGWLHAALLP